MSVLPSSSEYAGSDPDLSGQKLGNYQLLRRLGRGGMADVYLAEQLSLRRQVAFKVLKRSLAEDEAYVRRFHNEARAAASLVHANIVQIHEVGCLDGVHYIAQEYVAGQNLKQWLARHRTADTKTAIHIMRQVVAVLELRFPAGHYPPRHQAGKHHAGEDRRGEGGGFRAGTRYDRWAGRELDPGGRDHGNAAVHEPRTGGRTRRRSAQRSVFVGRDQF